MATAIKRISDDKIIIECSEAEFELMYNAIKIQQYRAEACNQAAELRYYTEIRSAFQPIHNLLK